MSRTFGIFFLIATLGSASLVAQAQFRRGPGQADATTADVALQIGSKKYETSGHGECRAAPQASIYGVNAALYSVTQNAAGRALHLTLWQPKDGSGDMMQLQVSEGAKRFQVDTVKAGSKRDTKGSGRTTFQKSGEGGVFNVDAVAASGERIRGTVRCSRFGAVHAEGG